MGYFGKIEDKLLAQKLRRHGLSYGEILEKVNVSKDTISRWCRDISLTEKQKKRLLNNKRFGQKKGSLIAAENKRKARFERIKWHKKEAKKDIGYLSDRDKFIAGIALYTGEGQKTDRQVGFANSDPKLIKFMMEWFLKFLKISLTRMRGAIWLHEGLSEKKAKKFWSNLTGIPLNQFHKTYIAKVKNNSKKIRKNIHKFGVFSIRFSDSDKHRRLMGWIYAIIDGKIPTAH